MSCTQTYTYGHTLSLHVPLPIDAPSIADNTRASLSNGLAALAHSEYGQLVLASLPGLSSDSARKIGEAYETLGDVLNRTEEHTSELQSLMRKSYAVFCLKKKNQ